MINQIWKYEIPVADEIKFKMPEGAVILTVQIDTKTGRPHMWAIVNPKASLTERVFNVYGTGHNIDMNQPNILTYIGTFQILNGGLIFHLFENKKNNQYE